MSSDVIYYCGWLDHLSASNLSPIIIRAYDLAGNLLHTIRQAPIPIVDQVSGTFAGGPVVRDYFDAIKEDGTAVLAHTRRNPAFDFTAPMHFPYHLAATPQGHIYVVQKNMRKFFNVDGIYVDDIETTVYVDKVRKYRRNGDLMPWLACPHTGTIHAIAVDDAGHVYIGGSEAADHSILHKYTADGDLVWSVSASSLLPEVKDSVVGITVDTAGNVYTAGGKEYGGGLIRKYNSSGVLQWIQRPASNQWRVVLDGAGHLFTSGAQGAGYWLTDTYFTAFGTLPGYIGVEPPPEDFYYYDYVDGVKNYHAIAKWDASDGSYINSTPGSIGQLLSFDGTSLHAVHSRRMLSDFTQKNYKVYDTDLSISYEEDVGAGISDLFCNAQGGCYFLGTGINTVTSYPFGYSFYYLVWHLRGKLADHSEIWLGQTATQVEGVDLSTYTPWRDLSPEHASLYASVEYTTAFGVLTGPDLSASSGVGDGWRVYGGQCVESEYPALMLPVALANVTWQGDRYTLASSLPLPLALRGPTWIRELLARYAPPTIYRASVQKSPLPDWPVRIGSLSLRRENGGQTAVSLVCPALTLTDLTALEARLGGDLVVYRGPRFADGSEQLDELVRVVFTGCRYDSGANRASVTMEGSITTPAANPKTRTARGISYRNQSARGRQVRCEVDTWLRPGDQLDLGGGELLTVDSVACAISLTAATMDVLERLL